MPILIPRPPTAELILAASQLLRTGLPPLLPSPVWTDPAAPCPPDHWLLPAGTRIFSALEAEAATSPCVILETGDAVQHYPDSRHYWNIPFTLSLMLARKHGPQEIDTIISKIVRLFTERVPTGDPRTERAWHRLTTASLASSEALGKVEHLHAFTFGFREIKHLHLVNEHKHPLLKFSFALRCGTATALPAAA